MPMVCFDLDRLKTFKRETLNGTERKKLQLGPKRKKGFVLGAFNDDLSVLNFEFRYFKMAILLASTRFKTENNFTVTDSYR